MFKRICREFEWRYPIYRKKFVRYCNRIKATVLQNGVRTFWWAGKDNFGDLLTFHLLRHYGYTAVYCWSFKGENASELVSIGSILQIVDSEYAGIILGSGLIADKPKSFPNAMIIGLRGHMTKQLIDCKHDVVLGDPGLLVNRLFRQIPTKKYKLGFIPHYAELDSGIGQKIFPHRFSEVKLIDPRHQPKRVLHDIAQCEYILSSSLHGLIVADAFGIPNGRLYNSDLLTGGDFKFNDYYSALGVERGKVTLKGTESLDELIGYTHAVPETVKECQENLDNVFRNLGKFLQQLRDK
ncbi:MAG: polysaccharide pyruvyl transferase family protein [Thermoguttaceae bacterium]